MRNQNQAFCFNQIKNNYLNNRVLIDEMQYVLDRKQYEINLGNILEKQSLLMKPQFIRDTTTEIKIGRLGKAFNDISHYENDLNSYRRCMIKEDYEKEEREKGIKVHNFINTFPYIRQNLIPNENGEIIIKNINLKDYSFLHILCFDNTSCSEDCFYLNNGITSLRDLRALNEYEINKNYCEFRKLYPLSKKEKHYIKDINSLQYKIFDSLEKYIEFINIVNPSLKNELENFKFLIINSII